MPDRAPLVLVSNRGPAQFESPYGHTVIGRRRDTSIG